MSGVDSVEGERTNAVLSPDGVGLTVCHSRMWAMEIWGRGFRLPTSKLPEGESLLRPLPLNFEGVSLFGC